MMYRSTAIPRPARCSSSKPGYFFKIRLCRSKAVLVILLWVFTAILNATMDYNVWFIGQVKYSTTYLGATLALSIPIVLLADVYVGRYRVIRCSIQLLWLAVIVCNVSILIQQHYLQEKYKDIAGIIVTVFTIVGVTGSAGILVNSLQFGTDQLIDASSAEITSFISWSTWTALFGLSVGILLSKCLGYYYGFTLVYIVVPFLCTLSIIADMFLSHLLVKEPATSNPFRIIYQVLKYSAKNKYPRLRSAFTYWEDKPISRIDLGKSKYGGPFTTEQVEDVKTFFRILGILFVCVPVSTVFVGFHTLFYFQYSDYRVLDQLKEEGEVLTYLDSCYYEISVLDLDCIAFVVLVPVIEFVLYPLLTRLTCCADISILAKFLLGIFFLSLHASNLLGIELIVTQTSDIHNSTCLYYVNESTLSLYWLISPKLLYGIALYVMVTSGTEFIAAQAPYSMRGLLYGMGILLAGLSEAIFSLFYHIVFVVKKHISVSNGAHCELWLYGSLLCLTVIFLCVGVCIKKCYKLRTRDEDLPNEQKFAVDYYEKYISMVT